MRKVFLNDLPKWGKNGKAKEGTINWNECIGHKIKFIYEDMEGSVNITRYEIQKNRITLKYKNKEYKILTGNFQKCKLGGLLGKVTQNFKIEIGTRFIDGKRDITIVERENRERKTIQRGSDCIINDKFYKYFCNKCGYDKGWMVESNLLSGNGCACCSRPPRVVVEGINDITTKEPWMIQYFQGGNDEAKLYTPQSMQKIYPICPDCGKVKTKRMTICDIYRNRSIRCTCGDSVSYPEKLMYNVLEQLNLDFQFHVGNAVVNWCKDYKYDFYFEFNEEEYILETHGEQHYKESFERIAPRIRTLVEEQKNDELKKQLALDNGIKNYIVIDCKKSELEWIKENILNSYLKNVFDFSTINWLHAEKYALSNLVKKACEIKRDNPNLTCTDIGKIMKHDRHTIRTWLKRGNGIWCQYDSRQEYQRNLKSNAVKIKEGRMKKVEVFRDGVSKGVFESGSELGRKSMEIFGVKLDQRNISSVCIGRCKSHKGFTFKYVEY